MSGGGRPRLPAAGRRHRPSVGRPGPLDRVRQTRRLLQAEGYAGVRARLAERVADRISPSDSGRLPIDRADLARAAEIAATGWVLPSPLSVEPSEPLTI